MLRSRAPGLPQERRRLWWNFDGASVVVAVGTTCSGGSTTAFVVRSGRVIGEGVTGR
jgi:hypothetical protein